MPAFDGRPLFLIKRISNRTFNMIFTLSFFQQFFMLYGIMARITYP